MVLQETQVHLAAGGVTHHRHRLMNQSPSHPAKEVMLGEAAGEAAETAAAAMATAAMLQVVLVLPVVFDSSSMHSMLEVHTRGPRKLTQ